MRPGLRVSSSKQSRKHTGKSPTLEVHKPKKISKPEQSALGLQLYQIIQRLAQVSEGFLTHPPFSFNTEDAARYIGVKATTLREWKQTGQIKPHQKDGKHMFWLREDLEKFVKGQPVADNVADTLKPRKKK